MKKSAHGLKIDGRKNLATNLKDNGLEKTKSKNSGFVKTKKSAIDRLEKKLAETTDQAEIKKIKSEIEKKENQIKEYLNK